MSQSPVTAQASGSLRLSTRLIFVTPGDRSERTKTLDARVGLNDGRAVVTNLSRRETTFEVTLASDDQAWKPTWYKLTPEPASNTTKEVQPYDGYRRLHIPIGVSEDRNVTLDRGVVIEFVVDRHPSSIAGRYEFELTSKTVGGAPEERLLGPQRVTCCAIVQPFYNWSVTCDASEQRVGFLRRKRNFIFAIHNRGNDWLYVEPLIGDGENLEATCGVKCIAVPPALPGHDEAVRLVSVEVHSRNKAFRGANITLEVPVSFRRTHAPSVSPYTSDSDAARAVVMVSSATTQIEPDGFVRPELTYRPPIPLTIVEFFRRIKDAIRWVFSNARNIVMTVIGLIVMYQVLAIATTAALKSGLALGETSREVRAGDKFLYFTAGKFVPYLHPQLVVPESKEGGAVYELDLVPDGVNFKRYKVPLDVVRRDIGDKTLRQFLSEKGVEKWPVQVQLSLPFMIWGGLSKRDFVLDLKGVAIQKGGKVEVSPLDWSLSARSQDKEFTANDGDLPQGNPVISDEFSSQFSVKRKGASAFVLSCIDPTSIESDQDVKISFGQKYCLVRVRPIPKDPTIPGTDALTMPPDPGQLTPPVGPGPTSEPGASDIDEAITATGATDRDAKGRAWSKIKNMVKEGSTVKDKALYLLAVVAGGGSSGQDETDALSSLGIGTAITSVDAAAAALRPYSGQDRKVLALALGKYIEKRLGDRELALKLYQEAEGLEGPLDSVRERFVGQ